MADAILKKLNCAASCSDIGGTLAVVSSATLLRLYYFASYTSFGVFLPFISPWLVSYGISGFRLSLVSASRPLAGIVAPLFFGWVADHFRLRGSLLRWACLASAVPFSVIAAFVVMGREVSFVSAFVAVAVFSFLRIPTLTIADVTAMERPRNFGALRLWGSMGFMLAALAVGGWRPDHRSIVFPLTISLSLLAAYAVARRLPARARYAAPDLGVSFSKYIARRGNLLMFVVWLLWSMSHVAYDMCISLQIHDLGGKSSDVSLAWCIAALAEIIMMASTGVLLPKATHTAWTFIGLFIMTLRWLLIAHIRSVSTLLALQPLHAFSFGLLWMAWLDYVKLNAPAQVLGRAQGILSTSVSVGAAAGMFIWGPMYAAFGVRHVFQGAAVVAGVTTLLSLAPLLGSHLQWIGSRQASSSPLRLQ